MPPRIVTISDHIDCPTGFGTQHRIVAMALAHAGFEVHSLGLWDSRPLGVVPLGEGDSPLSPRDGGKGTVPWLSRDGGKGTVPCLTRYPGGQGVEEHRRAWAMYRDLLRPDLVVTLGDLAMFRHLHEGDRSFAWCHWLPIDAEPYPTADHEAMLGYDRLVAMSHFGLELLRPHLEGRVPLHLIPHGVDTRVFRPLAEPLTLRRRWSRRLGARLGPADFVLVSRDTNQWRKQLPLLLDALARLPRDVKLILHCRPVAHPDARGWDLEHLARRVYGVADRVIFTGSGQQRPELSPWELAGLDNLADLRVAATQGEGFGICTIEAMACGTPTVITDYTTSRELITGMADCRSATADWAQRNGPAPPLAAARSASRDVGAAPGPSRICTNAKGGAPAAPAAQGAAAAGASGTRATAQQARPSSMARRGCDGPEAFRICTNAEDGSRRGAASSGSGGRARVCGVPGAFRICTKAKQTPPSPAPSHGAGRSGPCGIGADRGRPPGVACDQALDGFGQAGELVRVAAWTVEQDRHLLRPVIDPADLAAKVLALRDDPRRMARCAEAGLRRVLARYTTRHVATAWVALARQVLAGRRVMRDA